MAVWALRTTLVGEIHESSHHNNNVRDPLQSTRDVLTGVESLEIKLLRSLFVGSSPFDPGANRLGVRDLLFVGGDAAAWLGKRESNHMATGLHGLDVGNSATVWSDFLAYAYWLNNVENTGSGYVHKATAIASRLVMNDNGLLLWQKSNSKAAGTAFAADVNIKLMDANGDLNAAGGFRQPYVYMRTTTSGSGTQSLTVASFEGTANDGYPMQRGGSIVGVIARADRVPASGSLQVYLKNNGVAVAETQITFDNSAAQTQRIDFDKDTAGLTFAAEDLLSAELEKTSLDATTSVQLTATVES